MRACNQRSRLKSHAGTSNRFAPSAAYSRLSLGKSMSLQICNPQCPDGWSSKHSFIARLFRLDSWQQMMLVVVRL